MGKSTNQIEAIDLETATSTTNITDFSIRVGNTSTTNKWSVKEMSVLVKYNESSLSNPDIARGKVELFDLFPNPATTQISFSKPIYSVKIIDMTGRVIESYIGKTDRLDISKFESGMCFFKGVNTNEALVLRRFLKNK